MLEQEIDCGEIGDEPNSSCYGCRFHLKGDEDIWYCGISGAYGGPCQKECTHYSMRPTLKVHLKEKGKANA